MRTFKTIREFFSGHNEYEWDKTRLKYYQNCLLKFDKGTLEYEYVHDMINTIKKTEKSSLAGSLIERFCGLPGSMR